MRRSGSSTTSHGDFSECEDLAARHPEKLAELVEQWWVEASKYNVLPLDSRMQLRMGERKPGTIPTGNRRVFYPGGAPQFEYTAVNVKDRSHTITARGRHSGGRCRGRAARARKLVRRIFALREERPARLRAQLHGPRGVPRSSRPPACTPGQAHACVPLHAHGSASRHADPFSSTAIPVGEGEIPRTVPHVIETSGEGLCCGYDSGLPVTPDYAAPFRFTGRIEQVVVEIARRVRHHRQRSAAAQRAHRSVKTRERHDAESRWLPS